MAAANHLLFTLRVHTPAEREFLAQPYLYSFALNYLCFVWSSLFLMRAPRSRDCKLTTSFHRFPSG